MGFSGAGMGYHRTVNQVVSGFCISPGEVWEMAAII
jgi:hypothetical protein